MLFLPFVLNSRIRTISSEADAGRHTGKVLQSFVAVDVVGAGNVERDERPTTVAAQQRIGDDGRVCEVQHLQLRQTFNARQPGNLADRTTHQH